MAKYERKWAEGEFEKKKDNAPNNVPVLNAVWEDFIEKVGYLEGAFYMCRACHPSKNEDVKNAYINMEIALDNAGHLIATQTKETSEVKQCCENVVSSVKEFIEIVIIQNKLNLSEVSGFGSHDNSQIDLLEEALRRILTRFSAIANNMTPTSYSCNR